MPPFSEENIPDGEQYQFNFAISDLEFHTAEQEQLLSFLEANPNRTAQVVKLYTNYLVDHPEIHLSDSAIEDFVLAVSKTYSEFEDFAPQKVAWKSLTDFAIGLIDCIEIKNGHINDVPLMWFMIVFPKWSADTLEPYPNLQFAEYADETYHDSENCNSYLEGPRDSELLVPDLFGDFPPWSCPTLDGKVSLYV